MIEDRGGEMTSENGDRETPVETDVQRRARRDEREARSEELPGWLAKELFKIFV